ncbi:MAG: hypothetical protein Q9160_003558 [Pyrenula sp. 1 TL-2023]
MTPARLYCSAKTCSALISSRDIVDRCKQDLAVHTDDSLCPPDDEEDSLLTLAAKERWQKCNGCGNMVEKSDGCEHMICHLCSYEFCYICGREWGEHGRNCVRDHDPFPEPQALQNERLPHERVEGNDNQNEYDEGVDAPSRFEFGEELDLHASTDPLWPPAALDADRLRPLTAEEANHENYHDCDVWYHVSPYDLRTLRRRTPSQIASAQIERLDFEISSSNWVLIDAAEVVHHQELDRTGAPCPYKDNDLRELRFSSVNRVAQGTND